MDELKEYLRDFLNLREDESISEYGLYFFLTIAIFTGMLLFVWLM